MRSLADFTAAAVQVYRTATDQLTAKKKLEDSERYFRQIAEAIPQIVWTTRADGELDYLNNRWTEFTGRAKTQDSSTNAIHPEHVQQVVSKWNECLKEGSICEFEYQLLDAQRNYQWHIARVVPLKDKENRVIKWFGTATNID